MSFSKFFWGISRALLAATALILIAGMAFAILDDGADIFPAKSPDYDWSGGYVDARGNFFSSGVFFQCEDADNAFRIHCDADHPDKVRLSGQKGKVDQTKKDNNAHVWAKVSKVDGVSLGIEGDLICEQAKVKSKTDGRTEEIEAQCILVDCEIPFLTSDQIRSLFSCMDGAVEDGNLGKKVQNLKRDSAFKISGKITSKGVWGDAGNL
jgi:hypothetical protein